MKNRKTFLLLLLFLTIHLVFASKVKRHGSKGGKHGARPLVPGKGAAGYLLKTQRGKIYLQTPRKGKKSLKTSPASLVIYLKVLTRYARVQMIRKQMIRMQKMFISIF